MFPKKYLQLLLIILLTSCGGGDDNGDDIVLKRNYLISITNLTHNQPFSPLAAIIHTPNYSAWQLGQPASLGLERLAESGDSSVWLSEARAHESVLAGAARTQLIAPGHSDRIELSVAPAPELRLSTAVMLTNTNDAFSGLTAVNIAHLAVNQSITVYTSAYDAGTEANTETQMTIPGPAAGGRGFESQRDDSRDHVYIHPGVITIDEGLMDSSLDESHRFLNPVAQMTITRLD